MGEVDVNRFRLAGNRARYGWGGWRTATPSRGPLIDEGAQES
jgi:glycine/D-amino acid oxidase-like deaminating enzyme